MKMNRGLWFMAIAGVAAAAVVMSLTPAGTTRMFVADLAGSSEVPPVATGAGGHATFSLSADGMSMSVVLSVSNISNASASHIHTGAVGVNGPVVVGLFAGLTSSPFTGILAEGTLTQANLGGTLAGQPLSALVQLIDAGSTYVNVHTTQNPGGEIRGQVRPSTP